MDGVGESPGVEAGGDRDWSPGQPHKRPDDAQLVTDHAFFRNHRIVKVRYALPVSQWNQLRWLAETCRVERFSRSIADWRVA